MIPLDSRFSFVIGGSQDEQGRYPVERENLVLIDTMMGVTKVKFKKDLAHPVIHPACKIYDKRLLFIAGGQIKGQWITNIQIYDIEKGELHKLEKKDQEMGNIPVPLVGPSMSAEFFDTLGLIICGYNHQSKETEVWIY